MAPIARSKWPLAVSSNQTDSTVVRRLHLDVESFLQHRLDRLRPQLEARHVAHQEIEPLDAVGVAGGGHQRLGLLDRRGGIVLVADPLEQFSFGVANSENG